MSGPSSPAASHEHLSLDPQPLRWVVLPIILGLATFLRFLSLPNRGIFDSDQGRDFLVLRQMLVDGILPLLGPPASVGGVHHGAAYYYLLAPLAWVSGLDPTVVAMLFAVAGVAAVFLVWWLGREIAGPVAGLVAGLVYALSPTAIAASITNWNPNLIGLTATLTLAAAWRAWTGGRTRWWIVAIAAAGLTIQLHIVAVLYAIPVAGLLVADVRRRPEAERRALAGSVLVGVAVVVVLFLPLIVHELTTGFSEVRGAISFLSASRGASDFDPASRFLIISLRMASYPVVGLIIDAPVAASLLTGLIVAICFWRVRAARGPERTAIRLIIAILLVAAAGLALLVPDLARVTRGLPNDHYHAFTDPLIAVVLGLGVAAIVGPRQGRRRPALLLYRAERILVGATLIVILVFEIVRLPPRDDPNGGWPAAVAAAERIARDTPARTLLVVGLPSFKPTGGLIFPLLQVGREVVNGQEAAEGDQTVTLRPASVPPGALVVVCDRLFEPVIERACGGAAEETFSHPDFPTLIDRFDLGPRTSISLYGPKGSVGLQ